MDWGCVRRVRRGGAGAADAAGLRRPAAERARTPGACRRGGAVSRAAAWCVSRARRCGCGWRWAERSSAAGTARSRSPRTPWPGPPPRADPRAGLEPDTDGGWRVVSERRDGRGVPARVRWRCGRRAACCCGGTCRRAGGRRWTARRPGSGGCSVRRSRRTPRFFGLGGRVPGPRLRDGAHRLWHVGGARRRSCVDAGAAGRRGRGEPPGLPRRSLGGRVTVREGAEGAGSAHDRPGRQRAAHDGRAAALLGGRRAHPARVLHGWTSLTGGPALPPGWALGHQRAARRGLPGSPAVRRGRGRVPGARAAADRAARRHRRHGFHRRPEPLPDLHDWRRRAGRGAAGVGGRPGRAGRGRRRGARLGRGAGRVRTRRPRAAGARPGAGRR